MLKPQVTEGQEAAANFTRAMKKIFQVSKVKVKETERKHKVRRKGKKH